ncbi:MAG: chorismate synthase [Bacteroidota bacterium]
MGNTLGKIFRVTSFGESHGWGVGVVIDGCPAGITLTKGFIQKELDRRKPGQSKITTQRREPDAFEFYSGVFEETSTGAPITIMIHNKDQRSKDYDHIKDIYRPSHADYTYQEKYGIRDYRGGGRSSARITAGWVAAGAIAKQILEKQDITCRAYVSQVGELKLNKTYHEVDLSKIDANEVRCPDPEKAAEMFKYIDKVRKERDTIGGVVSGVIQGVPAGWGEPIFAKLNAILGQAMLSINAAKGFEYGSGFEGVKMKGSEHNDEFLMKDNKISTKTNHSGGIQGGISNGADIYFNVAFKPVATIMQNQQSVDTDRNEVMIHGKGRHDPCVVPRAVPIVEAMSAIVLADFSLLAQTNKLQSQRSFNGIKSLS